MSREETTDGSQVAGEEAELPPFTADQLAWLDRLIEARSADSRGRQSTSQPRPSGLVTAASQPGKL